MVKHARRSHQPGCIPDDMSDYSEDESPSTPKGPFAQWSATSGHGAMQQHGLSMHGRGNAYMPPQLTHPSQAYHGYAHPSGRASMSSNSGSEYNFTAQQEAMRQYTSTASGPLAQSYQHVPRFNPNAEAGMMGSGHSSPGHIEATPSPNGDENSYTFQSQRQAHGLSNLHQQHGMAQFPEVTQPMVPGQSLMAMAMGHTGHQQHGHQPAVTNMNFYQHGHLPVSGPATSGFDHGGIPAYQHAISIGELPFPQTWTLPGMDNSVKLEEDGHLTSMLPAQRLMHQATPM